jgi:hypothetical protein
MRVHLGLSIVSGLFVLLVGACGGQEATGDTYELTLVDMVLIGKPDSRQLQDSTSIETSGQDAMMPDSRVPLDTGLVDGNIADLVSELHEPDVVVEDQPPIDDIPGDEEVVNPPDLTVPDQGVVDAGPCGECPGEKPMCVDNVCVCTGDSCPAGFFCKGGECTPCVDDLHCGDSCESCASQGLYCNVQGTKCVQCDANHPCKPGNQCLEGECTECGSLGLCGPDCLQCIDKTPVCDGQFCICEADSCGVAQVCESGTCIECSVNDPLHCGAECAVCGEPSPHCDKGQCTFCNSNDACGPNCIICGGSAPHCRPDGVGCVACLEDIDCGAGFKCKQFECVADCLAEGCNNDLGSDGEKCADAKIVGRLVASNTFSASEDTSYDDNDDDLNYFFGNSECWDASYDHFYRIYLMAGESIEVTLNPNEPSFDAMLKLYTGTECDENGAGVFADNDKYLIQCWNDDSNGEPEGFNYTVQEEGWYTVVVDGRQTGEDEDYGEYDFTLKLFCTEDTCCCE